MTMDNLPWKYQEKKYDPVTATWIEKFKEFLLRLARGKK